MTVKLNHTIVWCKDKEVSAGFVTHTLGLGPAVPFGPFLVVEMDNGVSLDFRETDGPISGQHYAFLIDDEDFDPIFGRIVDQDLDHWADPMRSRPSTINHNHGGRGVYFPDPDGHLLEILTRPYGSAG